MIDPARRLLLALGLSRAHLAQNDLPPVPFGEEPSVETRFGPCDHHSWPFIEPEPMDEARRRQFSLSQLLSLIESIPFFSHTVISRHAYPRVLTDNGFPELPPSQYFSYLDTERWLALQRQLPKTPTTFTVNSGPRKLADFWGRLRTFNETNVQ